MDQERNPPASHPVNTAGTPGKASASPPPLTSPSAPQCTVTCARCGAMYARAPGLCCPRCGEVFDGCAGCQGCGGAMDPVGSLVARARALLQRRRSGSGGH